MNNIKQIKQIAAASNHKPWKTAIQVPIGSVPLNSFLTAFKKEIKRIRKTNPFCVSVVFDVAWDDMIWRITKKTASSITEDERKKNPSISHFLRKKNAIKIPKATLIIFFQSQWGAEEDLKKIHENLPEVVEAVKKIMTQLTTEN